MRLPHLEKPKKDLEQEHRRFNPHTYWVWLLCVSILLLTAELVYFSIVFLKTTTALDSPALPTLETNRTQINRMKKKVETVKEALKERAGITTSQNIPEVIE